MIQRCPVEGRLCLSVVCQLLCSLLAKQVVSGVGGKGGTEKVLPVQVVAELRDWW